jgi:hypothetical protein
MNKKDIFVIVSISLVVAIVVSITSIRIMGSGLGESLAIMGSPPNWDYIVDNYGGATPTVAQIDEYLVDNALYTREEIDDKVEDVLIEFRIKSSAFPPQGSADILNRNSGVMECYDFIEPYHCNINGNEIVFNKIIYDGDEKSANVTIIHSSGKINNLVINHEELYLLN